MTINLDVLYNLDEGPIPGQAGAARAPLQPAPSQAPRSRLLVAPLPEAAFDLAPEPAAVPESVATKVDEPAIAAPAPPAEAPEPAAVASASPGLPTPPAPPPAPELNAQPASEPTAQPAPDPAPASAPAAASTPEPAQTAALTPGPAPTLDSPIRVMFEPESASLNDTSNQTLSDLAARLKGAQGQRIQLLAYADASGGGDSVARRLSLSRALSVRGYLVSEGVPSSQIDVRALGAKYEEGPPDRVDIIYASR